MPRRTRSATLRTNHRAPRRDRSPDRLGRALRQQREGRPAVIRFDPSRTQQDLKERTAALQQAQSTLDQAIAQARIAEDQDALDLATAKYNVEKARLEASKQAIMSAISGEESQIDLTLAEEKLKVQETATVTHRKSNEQKIAAFERARDTAKRQVDLTRYQLSLMELKSPLDGVITYLPNYSQGWMNAQPFKVGDHAVARRRTGRDPRSFHARNGKQGG